MHAHAQAARTHARTSVCARMRAHTQMLMWRECGGGAVQTKSKKAWRAPSRSRPIIVMTDIVMADIVMADIVMAYTVMAYIAPAYSDPYMMQCV